jgi:hypothetical protein
MEADHEGVTPVRVLLGESRQHRPGTGASDGLGLFTRREFMQLSFVVDPQAVEVRPFRTADNRCEAAPLGMFERAEGRRVCPSARERRAAVDRPTSPACGATTTLSLLERAALVGRACVKGPGPEALCLIGPTD